MIKIEIQHVWLDYGRNVVVKDVTFQVKPGEMVGLIGPNGSGKSTIIRALSRVISSQSGRILLDGKDVTKMMNNDAGSTLLLASGGINSHH